MELMHKKVLPLNNFCAERVFKSHLEIESSKYLHIISILTELKPPDFSGISIAFLIKFDIRVFENLSNRSQDRRQK
jgi:hypothetical protein